MIPDNDVAGSHSGSSQSSGWQSWRVDHRQLPSSAWISR